MTSEVREATGAPPVWRRLAPLPWRGLIAGLVAAGAIILVSSGFSEDEAGWLIWWVNVFLPVSVVAWTAAVAFLLRIFGGRLVLAVATLSLIPGGWWALGVPYSAGTSEWNVAVLVAGAAGVALAEWVLITPDWIKFGVGAIVFVAGIQAVDLISVHVNEQRAEQATAKTPPPYTVDVNGWRIVEVTRFSTGRTSLVELRIEETSGDSGVVKIETFGREHAPELVCRYAGDTCRDHGR